MPYAIFCLLLCRKMTWNICKFEWADTVWYKDSSANKGLFHKKKHAATFCYVVLWFSLFFIIFHCISLYSIAFHCILSYSITFHRILSYSIAFYHVLSRSITFHHFLFNSNARLKSCNRHLLMMIVQKVICYQK